MASVLIAILALAIVGPFASVPARGATIGLITSPGELAALPMIGAAWDRMKAAADGSLGTADAGDPNGNHDVLTLAVALVYGRTGITSYRAKAADAIMSAIGTEDGSGANMFGRNLISYVISADLIDFASFDPTREAVFRSWLSDVRFEAFSDGSLVSEDRKRANNHGRVAGAARLIASLYLGDGADVAEAVAIFKGWLGDRTSYDGFTWNSDLSWQADPTHPVGVNPVGATKGGLSIDGALPEEMRRGCRFTVPPCPTTYPWGAFQGVLLAAEVLHRQGYDVWNWEDRALPRAVDFVRDLDLAYGGWWAKGDDVWQPWLINHAFGTSYPTVPVTSLGKTFGWTDWLWGPGSSGGGGDPAARPVASFTARPTGGDAPLVVAFTDTSSNGPSAWSWSFGDGASSTVQHPTHTYNEAGSYTVTLTAANVNGSDVESRTAFVTVAGSGANAIPACSPRTITTTQNGTGAEVSPACTDADQDPLTYAIASPAAKGVASVTAGNLRYVPNPGASGSDSFTYTASDSTSTSAPATVTVTIAAAGGGSQTFIPTDDTFVDSSSPAAINGNLNNLRVRSSARRLETYLAFTVSNATSVGSATLRLWVTDASSDGGSLFRVPDSSWREGTMNWSTRKAVSGGAIDSAGLVAGGTWAEFDVSSVVTGNGTYSFALINTSSDVARFGSSEASAATRPQLVVSP
jgi:PKD repeat protein